MEYKKWGNTIMKYKKLMSTLLVLLVILMAGCSNKEASEPADNNNEVKTAESGNQEEGANTSEDVTEPIVLKFATNNTDITQGIGKIEKDLMDAYTELHPNVTFDLELNENETHRQKLKVYAAANNLPDIYMNWADPSAIQPMAKNGYAYELNINDYDDYNFLPGVLGDCMVDGKLYGLPRNMDIWMIYYNEKLFADYGVKVPTTISELKEASRIFNENGIVPIAMNGKDRWNEVVLMNDLFSRTAGGQQVNSQVFDEGTKFIDHQEVIEATYLLKELADNNIFQEGYIGDDYVTAQNIFVQSQAAMYYVGSWEMGMGSREDFPAEFTDNVRATYFPMQDGIDTYKQSIGRTGGVYSVSPTSENIEVAIDFLNFMFLPENYSKMAWQSGALTPAQSWSDFMVGNETRLQVDITEIFSESTEVSGFMYAWKLTPQFEQDCLNGIVEMLIGDITPEEYWQQVDESMERNIIE